MGGWEGGGGKFRVKYHRKQEEEERRGRERRRGKRNLKVISRAEKRKLPKTSHFHNMLHMDADSHTCTCTCTLTHTYTSECLRKGGIVGRCNNRS